jgi:glutamine synthetase
MTEQYVIRANIEAETAAMIARTMILPAAVRHLETLRGGRRGLAATELSDLVDDSSTAFGALEKPTPTHQGEEGSPDHAAYMRDTVLPAMASVREVADRLEGIVPDDLWPLPKYAEILFSQVANAEAPRPRGASAQRLPLAACPVRCCSPRRSP